MYVFSISHAFWLTLQRNARNRTDLRNASSATITVSITSYLAQSRDSTILEAKAKELQEKLDNLRREFKDLKDNNENLKVEREELEERIQALTRENEDLKVSMGSSPESPSDTWWSFRADDEFPDPSNPGGAGSTSSYSGSHRSH